MLCMHTREASTLDLFCDSLRLIGDPTLYGIMEFDRRLDPEALRRAADACIRAHPVLHSRLVRGQGPARWELIADFAHPAIEPEVCGDQYDAAVPRFIDPYGTLQARVRLLRRPAGDTVIAGIAHAAADAYGLHALMARLLQEYAAPGSVPPADGGIPERDTLWTRARSGKGASDTADHRLTDSLWPDPFGTSDGATKFHRATIPQADLEAVRRCAKARGGNINDALIAAYFVTVTGITGYTGEKTVFFPVNLRQHLSDGSRVMSNQSTNVGILLARNEGDGIGAVLSQVIAKTSALKTGAIGIAEQAGMDEASDPEGRYLEEMVGQMAEACRNGRADIFISNPGPVSLPEFPGLAGAYVCYPCGAMPSTCFVASTFRGQLTVTLGYQDTPRAREGTRQALDLFCSSLRQLAGDGQA